MGKCCTSRRSGIVAGIVLLVLLAAFLMYVRNREVALDKAVTEIQPGMADADVQELLASIRHAKVKCLNGSPGYLFYGFDEFVTVEMESTDHGDRVAKINHSPDEGPYWDRVRRSWERRLR